MSFVIDRRFVLSASATLAAAVLLPDWATAEGQAHTSKLFDETYAKLTGGRTLEEVAGFTLDMPEQAENGNMVLFKLNADSPMSEAEHVKAFHLLSTQNPQAHVATFRLTPASGKAAVNGRMRLAKTQDVVALAEYSDGRLAMTRRKVEVTIGGCGL